MVDALFTPVDSASVTLSTYPVEYNFAPSKELLYYYARSVAGAKINLSDAVAVKNAVRLATNEIEKLVHDAHEAFKNFILAKAKSAVFAGREVILECENAEKNVIAAFYNLFRKVLKKGKLSGVITQLKIDLAGKPMHATREIKSIDTLWTIGCEIEKIKYNTDVLEAVCVAVKKYVKNLRISVKRGNGAAGHGAAGRGRKVLSVKSRKLFGVKVRRRIGLRDTGRISASGKIIRKSGTSRIFKLRNRIIKAGI